MVFAVGVDGWPERSRPGLASSAVIGGVRLLIAGPAGARALSGAASVCAPDDGVADFCAPDAGAASVCAPAVCLPVDGVADLCAPVDGLPRSPMCGAEGDVTGSRPECSARISPRLCGAASIAAEELERPPAGCELGTTPRLCADGGNPRPAAQDSGLGNEAGATGASPPPWPASDWPGVLGSAGVMVGLPNMIVAPASEPTVSATPVEVIGRRPGSDILVNVRSALGSTPSSGTMSRAMFLRRGMTYGEAERCAGTAGNGCVGASPKWSSRRGRPLRPSRSPRVIAVKTESRVSWLSS
ncbi:MAG TPA: hypothetical protein VL595_35440 [Pseudonocardia sp.]|nr:hypothetical protein [Pseudonocardia sp.]